MIALVRASTADLAGAAGAAGVTVSVGPTDERGWTPVLLSPFPRVEEDEPTTWLEGWPHLVIEDTQVDPADAALDAWRLVLRLGTVELVMTFAGERDDELPEYSGAPVDLVADRLVDLFGYGARADAAAVLRNPPPDGRSLYGALAGVFGLPVVTAESERELVLYRGPAAALNAVADGTVRACGLSGGWTALLPTPADDGRSSMAAAVQLVVSLTRGVRRSTVVMLWRGGTASGWSLRTGSRTPTRMTSWVPWMWHDGWLNVGPGAEDEVRQAAEDAVRALAAPTSADTVRVVLERADSPRAALGDFARLVGLPSEAVAALSTSRPETALPRLAPLTATAEPERGLLSRVRSRFLS